MAGSGVEYSDFKKWAKNMEKIQTEEELFYKRQASILSQRLLEKVIKLTPIGDYKNVIGVSKTGGTLRRNWTIRPPQKSGNNYTVIIFNPTTYAIYVEFGHRQTPGRFVPALGKRLKTAWVEGRFMLKKSILELENEKEIYNVILKNVMKFYGRMFDV